MEASTIGIDLSKGVCYGFGSEFNDLTINEPVNGIGNIINVLRLGLECVVVRR